MTDEQIEKALYDADDIAINEKVDCCDVLEYITRLKAECVDKENYTIELYNRARNAEDKLKEVRKETAKMILQDLKDRSVWFIVGTAQFVQDHFWEQFDEMCRDYGVEVEE